MDLHPNKGKQEFKVAKREMLQCAFKLSVNQWDLTVRHLKVSHYAKKSILLCLCTQTLHPALRQCVQKHTFLNVSLL